MQLSPVQWSVNADFVKFKTIVDYMNIVNDRAEIAVKDVSDFANYCQDPYRWDDVVRVVNSHSDIFNFVHLTKNDIAII